MFILGKSVGKSKKILAIILIFALFLRITFALIVPIFEKPDEYSHFGYIDFVSDNKKLPVQQEGQRSSEFYQPPFYHILASSILSLIKIFTQNIWIHVIYMRILSVIVSMFTLYFIYKMASLIFHNNNLVLGIVAFAAFLPSHINMNSTVTNANFGYLTATLIMYLLLNILIKGENKNKIILLGIIAGISLLTRLTILPTLAIIPLTFIVKYYPNIKRAIKPIAIIAAIVLVISAPNFIRNYALYGDFIGFNAMRMASPASDLPEYFIPRLLGWTFVTFWAAFGITNGVFIGNLTSLTGIVVFIIAYLLLLAFTLASFYGLYSFFKKYRKNRNILNNVQKKAFILMFFHLVLTALFFISFNFFNFQPQGRLLFPAISTIAILFTFGIYSNFSAHYWRKSLIVYLSSFILLNIISIISVVYYYLKI